MSVTNQDTAGMRTGTGLRTDAELAAAAAAGIDEAFAELYRRHAQTAWRVAQSVTHNGHDASDAVSEAFTRVLKSVQQGRLTDGASFRSYLLSATRNAAIDAIRKDGRVRSTDDDTVLDLRSPGPTTPADDLEAGSDASMVVHAFKDLPERWRAVLWLTEVEGLPPREAAAVLGLSANGAAQLAVRARAGLRERYLQAHLRDAPEESCRFTVERLGAYVGGGLSARDLAKVDQHLAGCSECQARRDELEDLGRPLRRAILPIPLALGSTSLAAWKATLAGSTAAAGSAGAAGAGSAAAGGLRGALQNPPAWMEKALGSAAATVLVLGVFGIAVHGVDVPEVAERELAAPAVETPAAVTDDVPETAPIELPVAAAPAPATTPVTGDTPAEPADEPAPPPEAIAADPTPPATDGLLPEVDEDADDGADEAEENEGGVVDVGVGGRYDTNTAAVKIEVGGECTGISLGETSVGCEAEAPEEDGLEVSVGGEVLPETTVSLP